MERPDYKLASCKIVLYADSVLVAEVVDARLWGAVYGAILGRNSNELPGYLSSGPLFHQAALLEAQEATDCGCETCRPMTMADMRMILCAICGNKRCPHATDHRNACTNSNEAGQPGSSYGPAKQEGGEGVGVEEDSEAEADLHYCEVAQALLNKLNVVGPVTPPESIAVQAVITRLRRYALASPTPPSAEAGAVAWLIQNLPRQDHRGGVSAMVTQDQETAKHWADAERTVIPLYTHAATVACAMGRKLIET